jgi:hypothetical protein
VEERAERWLRYATILYAIGLALHSADHFRRGLDVLTPEVFWGGNVITVIGVTAIALVFLRHRLAPVVAVIGGWPIAIGVTAAHLLPHWSVFSDAFPGSAVSPVSWAAVLIEIAGALALGAAGAYALRVSRRPQPA